MSPQFELLKKDYERHKLFILIFREVLQVGGYYYDWYKQIDKLDDILPIAINHFIGNRECYFAQFLYDLVRECYCENTQAEQLTERYYLKLIQDTIALIKTSPSYPMIEKDLSTYICVAVEFHRTEFKLLLSKDF